MVMPPNSFKVKVKIEFWPFDTLFNSLKILFAPVVNPSLTNVTYNTEEGFDVNGNLKWVKSTVEDSSLYLF